MALAALIKKGGLREVATAIPATVATEEENKDRTVARIATIAIAKPPTTNVEEPTEPLGSEVATAIPAIPATTGTDRNNPQAPPAVESMTPAQFEQAGQVITWRTGSGRTIYICPNQYIDRCRRHGEAWFTPAEIVELRAMQLAGDTLERIIDMKELLGAEICGTC